MGSAVRNAGRHESILPVKIYEQICFEISQQVMRREE